MLNQNQNQTSFQSHQDDQIQNPYPKLQIKDQNSNIQLNSKYSQGRNYQSQMDYRNSSNRDRSRSNEHSPRQSFHEYRPGNNMKSQNRNNYNMNNRNNKPYYYRQNNERQFEPNNRFKNERNNFRYFLFDFFSRKGYLTFVVLILLVRKYELEAKIEPF